MVTQSVTLSEGERKREFALSLSLIGTRKGARELRGRWAVRGFSGNLTTNEVIRRCSHWNKSVLRNESLTVFKGYFRVMVKKLGARFCESASRIPRLTSYWTAVHKVRLGGWELGTMGSIMPTFSDVSLTQSLFRHHTNVAQFLLTDRQTELEEKKSAISSCYQKFLLLCILEHCENFLLFFIIFFLVTCLFMWNRPEPCLRLRAPLLQPTLDLQFLDACRRSGDNHSSVHLSYRRRLAPMRFHAHFQDFLRSLRD